MQPKFTFKKTGFIFKTIPVFFILFTFFVGKINAQCTWSASTVYPVPILDQANATVGTNLYSFAGVSSGAIVTNSYKFDGTTWTSIAAFPVALEFPSAVSDGTNAYIVSGSNNVGTSVTTLYRYNVAGNTYTPLASCGTATWNQTAVYYNGKIYKFGGFVNTVATNVLEIYDIATNTWSTGAPYPTSVGFLSSWVQGNFIYGAGGTDAGGVESAKTYRYDPATNTWDDAAIADLPASRWGFAGGFFNGFFVLGGGYRGGVITNTALIWDPVGNSWSTLPNMLGDRARMNGAVLNGSVYVIGGRSTAVTGFTGTNDNQKLSCNFTACSGTPNPGNTVSSSNPVCPNVNFTLSLQVTQGTGTTHQWQSSPNGTTWTNIGAATGSTYTTSQTVATYYRDSVRCTSSGQFAYSSSLLVTMNPVNACYCIPTYTNGCTFGDYIANVTLLTLNNSSTCSTPPFTYYSAVAAPTLIAGGTYTVSVTVGPDTFGQNVGVWIDYNQDGVFSPSEFLATPINAGASGTANLVFSVPANASVGTTRMRIRGGDDVAMTSGQACGASNSTFGEAEDYNVTIAPCVTGVFSSQPSNQSVQCGSNATFSATNTGSALTYHWEYRTTPSGIWFNVPNAAPYSGVNTNTLTITNTPATLSGYQYRLVVEGPCTATDFSTPATLTVTPLVVTVNPSSATICTGSVQQLTITNAASPTTSTFSSGAISIQIPDGIGPPASTPPVCDAGINHTIPVSIPAGSVITRMDITFNITHTYSGDLIIVLKAPNGQILNLDDHKVPAGTGGANFVNTVISSAGVTALANGTAPYTGIFRPDAQIGAGGWGDATGTGPTGFAPTVTTFAGLWSVPSGNWTLAICDPYEWRGDIGTITSWSIAITYGAPVSGIWTSSPSSPNTMFTDPGATVAYTGVPANTIYVKPTVNTNYTVIATTPTPCTSLPTVVPVNVTNPVTSLTVPATKSVCVGDNATITATANGGPITWQWQVSNNNGVTYSDISGATSAMLTLNNVTQLMNNYRYRVVATASPCGSVTSASFTTLTVNPLPTVTLSANPTQVMPGVTTFVTASSTPAGAQYAWTLNGNPITGATTSSVFADVDKMGSYKVTVTDVNGCVRTSSALVISAQDNPRLFIYPNPNNGQFQARLYSPSIYLYDVHVVNIYNSSGAVCLTKTFPITSQYVRMDFDMRGYAAGVYVARITHHFTGKPVEARFVIQH